MSQPKWEDTEELVPKWDDTEEVPDKAAPSMLESGIRGAAQGASLGFADELTGGLEALYDVATTDKSLGDLKDLYAQHRDESRANYQSSKEANPYTYGAGELGGVVATSFVPGLGFAKGASLAKNAIQGVKLGAASGLGGSNADLTKGEVGQAAWDTAKGAAVGGAAAGAASYAGNKVSDYIGKRIANRGKDAAKELGVYTPENISEYGKEHLETFGESALDRWFKKPMDSVSKIRNEAAGDLAEGVYRDQVAGLPVNRATENLIGSMSVTTPTPNDAMMNLAVKALGGTAGGAVGYAFGGKEGAAAGALAGAGGKYIANRAPALKLAQFLSKNPKYLEMLNEAARRGQNALATTMFLLQQKDPEFQEGLKQTNE